MQFPAPIKIGPSATRWRLSDLEAYEAAAAGEPTPAGRTGADERYLTVRQVATRYGTHPATIWRWTADGAAAAAS